jgi:hypothetical protein
MKFDETLAFFLLLQFTVFFSSVVLLLVFRAVRLRGAFDGFNDSSDIDYSAGLMGVPCLCCYDYPDVWVLIFFV